MIATTAGALPGVRLVRGPGATAIRGVAIDSRAVGPGDLFVAVRGGHAFTAQARAAGAAAVLVEEGRADGEEGVVLAAPDTVEALAAIGAANAAAATGCTVVAITGSSGKTSTKDALHAMLAGSRRAIAAAAGHNNEIGLPLTLCAIAADTEVAVCEMAMRGPGQIAALAALARPRIGVVTNVGTAHLGVLGSREAIAAAKAEVLQALPDGGVAVVPHREALLVPALRPGLRVLTFGEGEGPDVAVVARTGLPGGQRVRYRADGDEREVELPVTGRHQAVNVAAALAAARALGVGLDAALAGVVALRLQPWRGEIVPLGAGAIAINDAYNANPASVGAALETLAEREVRGRRIAVLGQMAELGDEGPALHAAVGAEAAARGIDVLVAVGPGTDPYLEGAGPAVERHAVAGVAEAVELVAELVRPGDAVLVKGSRSVGLEGLAAGVAARLAKEGRP